MDAASRPRGRPVTSGHRSRLRPRLLIAELSARTPSGHGAHPLGHYFGVGPFGRYRAWRAVGPWGHSACPGLPAIHAVYMALMAALLTLALSVSRPPRREPLADAGGDRAASPRGLFLALHCAPPWAGCSTPLPMILDAGHPASLLDPAARGLVAAAIPLPHRVVPDTSSNTLLRRCRQVRGTSRALPRQIASWSGVLLTGPSAWLSSRLFAASSAWS